MASDTEFSIDRFGVPSNCLKLSDDFYGALGRVSALGALVESRLSDVIATWTMSTDLSGRRTSDLVAKFSEITESRSDVPPLLIQLVADADAAMKARNVLIHSLWPAEGLGWKHEAQVVKKGAVVRPYSTTSTAESGIADVIAVIHRLAAVVRPLGTFAYTPID